MRGSCFVGWPRALELDADLRSAGDLERRGRDLDAGLLEPFRRSRLIASFRSRTPCSRATKRTVSSSQLSVRRRYTFGDVSVDWTW